jgi:hypothetical protein
MAAGSLPSATGCAVRRGCPVQRAGLRTGSLRCLAGCVEPGSRPDTETLKPACRWMGVGGRQRSEQDGPRFGVGNRFLETCLQGAEHRRNYPVPWSVRPAVRPRKPKLGNLLAGARASAEEVGFPQGSPPRKARFGPRTLRGNESRSSGCSRVFPESRVADNCRARHTKPPGRWKRDLLLVASDGNSEPSGSLELSGWRAGGDDCVGP